MMEELTKVQDYAPSGLLWLVLTVAVYALSDKVMGRLRINPVLLSTSLLIGVLLLTDTAYPDYFQGAWPLHFLLGTATVALAVPLFRHFDKVKRSAAPMLAALVAGSGVSAVLALGLAWALGAPLDVLLALVPKSVTTPIAIGVALEIGGPPPLTAGLVIATGITGATLAVSVMRFIKIDDHRALGFAVGTVSHGIGTARALRIHEVAGTFSGLAMGLNGLGSALLIPLLFTLLG